LIFYKKGYEKPVSGKDKLAKTTFLEFSYDTSPFFSIPCMGTPICQRIGIWNFQYPVSAAPITASVNTADLSDSNK